MNKKKKMELDMTKGAPLKLIGQFIGPVILGNIFQQFYSMVDTIIVGRYVGVQALAAVGMTGTIMFLILGFVMGMTTGFTVITSQRFGAGDYEGVKKSIGSAVTLSAIVVVIVTFLSQRYMDKLLVLMNTPEDIYDMAKTYILIICGGIALSVLYNLMASVLRAIGNSKVPLYFLIFSAFLNIFLDLFFILNLNMGVAGAAWATILSQGISGILCVLYIMKYVEIARIRPEHLKLEFYLAKNQLYIGIPMALQFSITAVGTTLVQSALNLFGSTVVASYTAACKVEQFITQPFAAMGMTMATYCGQNRGLNDWKRIREGARSANLLSGAYALIVYGVAVLIMPYVVGIFVTGDVTEVITYANTYIRIVGTCFIPLGMIFIFRNVLQGCGYSFIPMMGGVVELIVRAIFAEIAVHYHSYEGVCMANAGAWLATGVFLLIAYWIIMRKKPR